MEEPVAHSRRRSYKELEGIQAQLGEVDRQMAGTRSEHRSGTHDIDDSCASSGNPSKAHRDGTRNDTGESNIGIGISDIECKSGFPLTNELSDIPFLVCHCIAEERGLRQKG